jgi:hypothetical protein
VIEELTAALSLCEAAGEQPAIIAVNDMIALLPGDVIAASLHHHKIGRWLRARAEQGYPAPIEVWGYFRPPHMPHLVSHVTADWGGSAGLFGVCVAMQRGHARIICAGVPMSPEAGHVVRGVQVPWTDCERYRKGWVDHHDQIVEHVRSMSGWTAARLGRPDVTWLGKTEVSRV